MRYITFLIESVQRENHTELVLFSRDKDNKKVVERVSNFSPYFYVPEDSDIPSDNRISKVETGYMSISGEKLSKVYVMKSIYVRELRELFPKHYEADILVTQRYTIDVLDEADVYPLEVLSLDIETDDSKGFPDAKNPIVKILSCSFCNNHGKKKEFLWLNEDYNGDYKSDEITTIVNSEKDLLYSIIGYIRKEDPDLITGWNIVRFDLMYLVARMKKLEIDYKKLSPLGIVNVDMDREEVQIKGRIILDGMTAYSHFRKISNQGKADSYSLEFTAQDILKTGKIKHKEKITEMWKNNPEKLVEYNLRDSELVIEILNKLDIVDFFNYLRSKSFSNFNQIFHTSTLVDGLILRKVHNKIVLPSKNKTDEKKFSGAHVFSPKPGIYEDVIVMDVGGMYPNLEITFDISYETFNPKGEIQIKSGIGFDKGCGLIPQIMKDLKIERDYFKKLKKEAKDVDTKKINHFKQYSVKVLMNAGFGYLGYPGSRLYKREVASAITEMGQELIKWIAKYVSDLGYEIIYGDTDSIFLQGKSKGILTLLKEGKRLNKNINSSFKEFAKKYGSDESTLEMEFEKIFKRVIFVGKKDDDENGAKKKYAYTLLWHSDGDIDDDVHYTGFDGVRSDNCKISRTTQKEVIRMILNDYKKEDIIKYVTDLERDVKCGKITIEDIGFPKGVSGKISDYGGTKKDDKGKIRKIGTPPVIQGIKYSNKFLGTNMGQGSKPKWLYIKKVPHGYPDTKVLSFEDEIPKGFVPDYELMIEKIFKNKLEAIFLASGFGEFPNINHNIKKLSDYKED